MNHVTVNISFHGRLLREIDRVAREEARSRSELLREAARAYIERKNRWADIFRLGRRAAARGGISPGDVGAEIAAHRKRRASGR